MGTTFGPLVTVSATYGAGGSIIAPRLAAVLGVPFLDRLISADMSEAVARRRTSEPDAGVGPAGRSGSTEGLHEDEQAASPAGRFLSYFARAASVGALVVPDVVLDDDETIRQRTEEGLRDLAAGAPAVLLGRAGAVVLASRPRAYHVRLDGPVERRVAWAASIEQLDLEAVKRRQGEADKARSQFVKRVFHTDPADPRLYHQVIDPTVLGVDATVRVVHSAAEAFFAAALDF
jgi:cytidylate kinase